MHMHQCCESESKQQCWWLTLTFPKRCTTPGCVGSSCASRKKKGKLPVPSRGKLPSSTHSAADSSFADSAASMIQFDQAPEEKDVPQPSAHTGLHTGKAMQQSFSSSLGAGAAQARKSHIAVMKGWSWAFHRRLSIFEAVCCGMQSDQRQKPSFRLTLMMTGQKSPDRLTGHETVRSESHDQHSHQAFKLR